MTDYGVRVLRGEVDRDPVPPALAALVLGPLDPDERHELTARMDRTRDRAYVHADPAAYDEARAVIRDVIDSASPFPASPEVPR